MPANDPHNSPNNVQIGSHGDGGSTAYLIRTQWGKERYSWNLHVQCTTYYGCSFSFPDFLRFAGFQMTESCRAIPSGCGPCVWCEVPEHFELASFLPYAIQGMIAFQKAADLLRTCGVLIPVPFEVPFFKTNGPIRPSKMDAGDGHNFRGQCEPYERVNTDCFRFIWNYFTQDGQKGFVHHVSRLSGQSLEDDRAFKFLGFNKCSECSFLDFEPCYWLASPDFKSRTNDNQSSFDPYESHQWHARCHSGYKQNFERALGHLLESQRTMKTMGWDLFEPLAEKSETQEVNAMQAETAVRPEPSVSKTDFKYDVAISFAGPQRELAEAIAKHLSGKGFRVFYDTLEQARLWGADLPTEFKKVFQLESKYCLMLISQDYASREWTTFERRNAIARLVKERGNQYVLPVRLDDAEIDGLPSTIGHLDLRTMKMETVLHLLLQKLNQID